MVQLGYFDNLKGGPTLLIAATGDDFAYIAEVLSSDSAFEGDLVATLRKVVGDVHLSNISRLTVTLHAPTNELSVNGTDASWAITDAYRTKLSGLIKALSEEDDAAHQYLDTGGSPIQLVVSKGEYARPLS